MKQSRLVSYNKNGLWAIAALMIATAIVMLAMPSGESDAATSGNYNEDITWTLEDGHLIIDGTGEMYNEEYEEDYSLTQPWGTDIKSFEIKGSITTIGENAFGGCKSLTTAVIPKSVTAIWPDAFCGCTSLKSVEIQGNLKIICINAFGGCTSLERVKLPDVIEYVDIGIFFKCNSIKYINIPSSFDYNIDEYAGPEAFEDITFLDSKGSNISTSIGKIKGKTFVGENSVVKETPDNVKFYANGLEYQMSLFNTEAFLTNCSDGTTGAIVPDTVEYNGYTLEVTKVGTRAFYGSKTLMSMELPNSITEIGDKAFTNCTSLKYIEFPDSLESVGDGAFSGVTFKDSGGNVLDINADALRGKTFIGNDGVLTATPKTNAIFSADGLLYKVLSLDNSEVALIGYIENVSAIVVPDAVEYHGYPMNVTKIGNKAFYDCSDLRSLDLGNVREIGVKAFANCIGLSDVTFGKELTTISAYAFYNCRSLESIEISDSTSLIGSYAFYRCTNLKEVDLGDSLTNIYTCSFSRCPSIERILIPKSLSILEEDSFGNIAFLDGSGNEIEKTPKSLRGHSYAGSDGVLVRESEPEVGDLYSFDGIVYKVTRSFPAELEVAGYEGYPTSISIPETIEFNGFEFDVSSIGKKAFYGCRTLADIEMPYVDSIGVKAFVRCHSLTSVSLGEGLEKISAYAFLRCDSMQSIDVPSSLKLIGSYAFYKCSALENVNFSTSADASIKTICPYAFYGCTSMTSLDLPDTLTKIGSHAFYGCKSLGDVEFGSSLQNISEYAFCGCTSLVKVKLGNSLQSIGDRAFYGCSSLSNVDLGLSLQSIGSYAFYNCPLSYLYVPDTLENLGSEGLGYTHFLYWYSRADEIKEMGQFSWKDEYYGTEFFYGWWDELDYSAESIRGYAYEEDGSMPDYILDFHYYGGDYPYKSYDRIHMKRVG